MTTVYVTTARRLKVAVYSIARDEASNVHRWAESCRDADVRLVCDTGSADGTQVELTKAKVWTYQISVRPWRFDDARNAALALLPADVDVCVSLDLDEVLEPGWRAELDRTWTPDATRAGYWYQYRPGIRYQHNRIHARHGYRWRGPTHERLEPYGGLAERCVETQLEIVQTRGDRPKSPDLALLLTAVAEDPSAHNLWYLGREYAYGGRWRECLETFARYLAHPGATWTAERAAAMLWVAKGHEFLRDDLAAFHWLRRACREAPDAREPLLALAQHYANKRAWPAAAAAVRKALAITDRQKHFLVDATCWGRYPHDLAAACAEMLGRAEDAARHYEEAVRIGA